MTYQSLEKNKEVLYVIRDKKEWAAVLKQIGTYDFYHTYDYHKISKKPEETPILIKYVHEETVIALPLLIRPIEDSPYKDATSVYGYAGPISKNVESDFDVERFHDELKGYFWENNIVTIFSRLNPLVHHQETILKGLGETIKLGDVVNMDLQQPLALQRKQYGNTLKTHLNRTKRKCSVRSVQNEREVREFIKMYISTMKRLDADDFYFFDEAYFFNLLRSSEFKADIMICIDNATNEILGGVLFITTNHIVQYHLSASKERYRHVYPTKLIIDQMRIISSGKGLSTLNLGGGVGSTTDSLFRFKASFSKTFRSFSVWRWIINETVNHELIARHGKEDTFKFVKSTKYFPMYRIKI